MDDLEYKDISSGFKRVEDVESAKTVMVGFNCAPSSFNSYATSGSTTLAMIQVRWKSDLPILETHPLTPGLKFVATPTTPTPARIGPTSSTPSAPAPTKPDPIDDGSSSSLSTGAKAGSGVGVAAAVLLLCIAIIIFRRHRSAHMYHPAEMQVEIDPKSTPTYHFNSNSNLAVQIAPLTSGSPD
ncbi:hypothetical protein B0T24DRAFT_672150 [Lasiosphaeria ovina]|uniref:Uncharacterized protein n=1 Tax=Lasiosphaeria ovina TaxID=92902 RepID=A0AAE0NIN3_9PEZI|nr:hypothetical protein B0T24DRAFT_672150 [Lasiosphaeria ovina]